ncbi:MFS general substrate transporter [Thozetella sp. PMI_491]|nr:MFS general substrate transporter [Thozetella sp. PMI_491]
MPVGPTSKDAEDTCLKNHDITRFREGVPTPPDEIHSEIEKPAQQAHESDGLNGAELAWCPSAASTLDFPDGGTEAWLVVFGAFCAMILVFGPVQTAAVFESYFATHQLADRSASDIGWIFSLYLFIVFFLGIQVGPIFDVYGPRLLVLVGSLLIALSMLLLGFCTEYYQIILDYSVLAGFGGALLNTPAYGAIAHFFHARRGLAIGVATAAGAIGGVAFPILMQKLVPLIGFAWSSRIVGFIFLALAVPANLFIRARLPPRLGPDGKAKMSSVLPDFTIFRDLRFALASLANFFMEYGLFMPLTFIVSYAAAHGQDANDSYVLLSFLNAASVLGRTFPGFVSDRFGRFNTILVTLILCVITLLALWLPARDSRPMLIAFCAMFGFVSGSNLSLAPVCLGQLCDSRDYGRYLSTAMMLGSFGTLSGVPIGGALVGLGGEAGWMAMILFASASYAMAFVCFGAARVLAVGWNPWVVF